MRLANRPSGLPSASITHHLRAACASAGLAENVLSVGFLRSVVTSLPRCAATPTRWTGRRSCAPPFAGGFACGLARRHAGRLPVEKGALSLQAGPAAVKDTPTVFRPRGARRQAIEGAE